MDMLLQSTRLLPGVLVADLHSNPSEHHLRVHWRRFHPHRGYVRLRSCRRFRVHILRSPGNPGPTIGAILPTACDHWADISGADTADGATASALVFYNR